VGRPYTSAALFAVVEFVFANLAATTIAEVRAVAMIELTVDQPRRDENVAGLAL
jgi:hypothetical protein